MLIWHSGLEFALLRSFLGAAQILGTKTARRKDENAGRRSREHVVSECINLGVRVGIVPLRFP